MRNETPFIKLDARARDIFRHIVDSYMESGDPVGSRTLSRSFDLSPATIRNVMADLEHMGLLRAPHTSAGRLPTDLGLRYFVDGILERGSLSEAEKKALEAEYRETHNIPDLFDQASRLLSGLSGSAGLVVAPKADKSIRHIEFVMLEKGKALVILVPEDGLVENRLMSVPAGITPDLLKQASNYLSDRLHGKSFSEMKHTIETELSTWRNELKDVVQKVVEEGLATTTGEGTLIVRGTANLLDPHALQDIDRVRQLMEQLESRETIVRLLEEAGQAQGVKIFIGAENPIFGSGHSLILTPYHNGTGHFVGAIGVIGPTRLDYAKIIPSVSFMAEMIGRTIHKISQG